MTTVRAKSSALTSLVVASRYMPVYIAIAVLVVVASIWAPATFTEASFRVIAPFGAYLAIAALGQMLVIMTGGIDLSIPGTLTMGAIVMVGVGDQMNNRIGLALGVALAVAAVIGLVNGILIAGFKLNALIVTLAMGQVVAGLVNRYQKTITIQAPVPEGLSEWASARFLGISHTFWVAVALTLLLALAFRYATPGRRFQIVGANPVAARVNGVRVTFNTIGAYMIAAMLYAIAGVLLGALLRTPNVSIGAPYLLGPIAAVVIGGAALTGGLASPVSTFAAAFFLAGLDQMMRVLRLPTSLQFVVFGLVIIGGMVVSGDRIIKGVEQVLRDRGRSKSTEMEEVYDQIE